MARSYRKGPFIDSSLIRRTILKNYLCNRLIIKSYSRSSVILPHWVGLQFEIYNGCKFISFVITEKMINHKLGEFSITRKRAIYTKK